MFLCRHDRYYRGSGEKAPGWSGGRGRNPRRPDRAPPAMNVGLLCFTATESARIKSEEWRCLLYRQHRGDRVPGVASYAPRENHQQPGFRIRRRTGAWGATHQPPPAMPARTLPGPPELVASCIDYSLNLIADKSEDSDHKSLNSGLASGVREQPHRRLPAVGTQEMQWIHAGFMALAGCARGPGSHGRDG